MQSKVFDSVRVRFEDHQVFALIISGFLRFTRVMRISLSLVSILLGNSVGKTRIS